LVPPRVGLYTAIYGGYEKPKKLPARFEIDAVLFTDNQDLADEAEALGWMPRVVPHHFESPNGDPKIVVPMLNHKYWKTHPEHALPDYDISIWIDGSMEIVVDGFVDKCLAALGDDDWACMRHPARNCIYPEAEYSATLTWRYDAPSILAQAEFYKAFHPRDWGLIATGFCVRRHNRYVTALCRDWWHEIVHRNHQDQISLPVLMRIHQDYVRMNYNLPWHEWLHHYEHGE
jgi:hypothetical protein